jgi:hypothetical protein
MKMAKKALIRLSVLLMVPVMLFVPPLSFTQQSREPEPPLSNWSFSEFVTLNGRLFSPRMPGIDTNDYAESWREQRGTALVRESVFYTWIYGRHGSGEYNMELPIEFWLYDSYAYHNGNTADIYRIMPQHMEEYYGRDYDLRCAIDWDNVVKRSPDHGVPSSIKALMSNRGCDIAVQTGFVSSSGVTRYLIIIEYSKSKKIYWTTFYHYKPRR